MNNMRRGFTMIELIFVIVIIGILAAVAIPKLAATRGDAEGAKIANNLATCITDAGGAYGMTSNFDFTSVACTLGLKTGGENGTACFTVAGDDATGKLTATHAGAGTQACDKAHPIAERSKMSSTAGEVHQF